MAMFGVAFECVDNSRGTTQNYSFHVSGAAKVAELIEQTHALTAELGSGSYVKRTLVTHEYKDENGANAYKDVSELF